MTEIVSIIIILVVSIPSGKDELALSMVVSNSYIPSVLTAKGEFCYVVP